jgi:putative serine protease PepD
MHGRPATDGRGAKAHGRRRLAAAALWCAAFLALVVAAYRLGDLRDDPAEPASGRAASVEPVTAVAESLLPSVVQLETSSGLGSGVVYDRGGLILTAAHVVEGAGGEVTIRVASGRRIPGRVLGTDNATDVGVVRAAADLTPATLGAGVPVEVGQLAVAIGSPFGLESTVTSGVVSAIGRSIPIGDGALSMIQTDAPINPGNSGGALADRHGRVIGINDAIRTGTGVNAGVGFAIPIDVAIPVADALAAGRTPRIGFLGVGGTTSATGAGGALVTEVQGGSPAAAAGVRPGDLITAFDGDDVDSMLDLMAKVRVTRPGTSVVLEVVRNGTRRDVRVVVGRQ